MYRHGSGVRAVAIVLALGVSLLALIAPAMAAAPKSPSAGASSTSPSSSGPASPGPSGKNAAGFGIQSATNGKPDARGYLTYSATPGARVIDEAAIVNIGNTPLDLYVYALDATTTSSGNFALVNNNAPPTDVGKWITIVGGPHTVHVPARTAKGPSYVIVKFELAVPADASPGDHAGAVAVSLTAHGQSKKLKVNLEQQIGLRAYVRVSGTLRTGLQIKGLHVSYAGPALLGNPFGGGKVTLDYTVENTGNVMLGALQSATISSWLGGDTQVKGLPIVPPLLPGTSVAIHRVVSGVFPGLHLTATVHLTPVAPQGASDPKLTPVSASASAWAFPWALLIIIVIVIGGVCLWLWRRHRRPAPSSARTSHRRSAVLQRTGASK